MIVLAAILLALGDETYRVPSLTPQPVEKAPTAESSAGAPANRGPIGYMTAEALAERCNDASPYSTTYCFAYLAGIHDTVRAYELWLGQSEFCPPLRLPQRQLRDDFLAFLALNPGYRDGQAASVAVVAMKDAFPCPPKNP